MALCAWSDTLEAWAGELERTIMRGNGVPYLARPEDVTFLELDDFTYRAQIERAITEFTRVSYWQKLHFNALRLLLLRAFCASRILDVVLDEQLQLEQYGLPADLGNRAGMIRWLFLDSWEMTASESRRLVIADFVKSRLGPDSSSDRETGVSSVAV